MNIQRVHKEYIKDTQTNKKNTPSMSMQRKQKSLQSTLTSAQLWMSVGARHHLVRSRPTWPVAGCGIISMA